MSTEFGNIMECSQDQLHYISEYKSKVTEVIGVFYTKKISMGSIKNG